MSKKITILLCILLFIGSISILAFSMVKAQSAQCTVGEWVYIQGWNDGADLKGLILDNGIRMGPSKDLDLNGSTIKNGSINQGTRETKDIPFWGEADVTCSPGYYMCGVNAMEDNFKKIICCRP